MTLTLRTAVVALVLTTIPLSVFAVEKKVSQPELPVAVRATVRAQSVGAVVKGLSHKIENGLVKYEAEMIVHGRTKDVTIDPNGAVLEIEEQVELNELPASVVAGFRDKAGKGAVTRVESISKHGAIVAYEAIVKDAARRFEVQVGVHGETLKHEE
jgi:hypothetical protein